MDLMWLLGLGIGLVMGVTGAGGGVLAVPALVFATGMTMQQSAPIAMVAVSIAASVGTAEGLWRGITRYRAAIVIGLAGWPLSAVGVWLAQRTPELVLRVVFVVLLFVIAWRQFGRSAGVEAEAPPPDRHVAALHPDTGRFVWTSRAVAGFCGIGGVTGFMSGLLGVSGGFVLVPLLSRLTPLSAASLVGTSLMVSALVTGFGAVAAVLQGAELPWPSTAWFALSLVAGMLAGRTVVRRLSDRWIHRAFALLVIGVAVAMAASVAQRLMA